jgi:hypothetical protein
MEDTRGDALKCIVARRRWYSVARTKWVAGFFHLPGPCSPWGHYGPAWSRHWLLGTWLLLLGTTNDSAIPPFIRRLVAVTATSVPGGARALCWPVRSMALAGSIG